MMTSTDLTRAHDKLAYLHKQLREKVIKIAVLVNTMNDDMLALEKRIRKIEDDNTEGK